MESITALLDDARAAKPGAREALYSRIYAELQKLARGRLAQSQPLTLLDAPALVHETFLRLAQTDALPSGNRKVFFAYAASVMRSVVVDYVRTRNAAKRGGGQRPVTLTTRNPAMSLRDPDLERLDDALRDLERTDERCARIVEMRYFAGMSKEEISEALEVSLSTIKRDWQKARALLLRAMRE